MYHNYNDSSSAVMPSGYCPYCSGLGGYVYHGGHCPQIKAKEYHRNGSLKRIEFVDADARVAGLHQDMLKAAPDFDAPMELVDSTKWAREVIIEEPTLLEPGKYTIVLGELYRVIDEAPPYLEPFPDDAGILSACDERSTEVPKA